MLGAIIGGIAGSRFEGQNNKSKEFDFFNLKSLPTDDSIMSLAIAKAILISKPDYSDLSKNAVDCMQNIGRNYPMCGVDLEEVFVIGFFPMIQSLTIVMEMELQ
ncbi:hypothetical protein [Thomasclavelia spiroformis]|uniref:hypothetical protein n=1 Tax=Thomasclavelia spiroformis TaxID=29348 RepID=UPI003990B550